MTEVLKARAGEISPVLARVASDEGMEPERLRGLVADGRVVLTGYARKHSRPIGIGEGLKTKTNANIGTSPDHKDADVEFEKLRAAVDAGADAVMDLSTGGDIDAVRRRILAECEVAVGTVPIYQAVVEKTRAGGGLVDCTADDFFDVIERQAKDGVDFMTIHCGLTRRLAEGVARTRTAGVVSRGGCFLLQWIVHNNRENPYYEHYDRLLDIAGRHDVALSLGDGLRPGAIADSTDRAQVGELLVIGELVDRARERGVAVFVEGPGHVPIHEIPANMLLQKKVCRNAPFYVLGPLVTDVAPGYDHITAAIGGAVAAWHGADFLCYVTPSEHLRLPSVEDVREGVIAARIAAHAGDIARGIPGAAEWDRTVSRARAVLDWRTVLENSIDPERAEALYDRSADESGELCSMCGEFCAIRGTMRSRSEDETV
ncbi:MAG: phosphomethylpyrimidine synthase ThiC [Candidatus Krumholzibacteriota bacterium]|nr:phosphomethylpyrimidine synthase ThiC [Candidatus Krumholzibacteriota bacterium]